MTNSQSKNVRKKTMTKAEITELVASQTNNSRANVEKMLEALTKIIISSLAFGRRVELRGFGIWDIHLCKGRVGRNPKKPSAGEINIPQRYVVRFKLGKLLKSAAQALGSFR